MGNWSHHVMGGDTPCDVECDIQHTFPLGKGLNTKTALEFLQKYHNSGWGDEAVMAGVFCLVRAGVEISEEIRQLGLAAIAGQLVETDTWDNPDERTQVLENFRQVLESYPLEGADVELDEDSGLFGALAEHLSK